jgi:hypothetical protein
MSLPEHPTAIDYLRDVLITQLALADDRVNIYNQKFTIPNDKHLFVGVEFKFSKAFASKSETEVVATVFTEKLGLNTQEHLAVLLFSRNEEALQRKEEAVLALTSIYARQLSDQYGFKIARLAPIQDQSYVEGGASLYRFEIPVIMLCRYEFTQSVPWYGTFPGEITIEDGSDVVKEFAPRQPT